VVERLVELVRALRAEGLDVGTGSVVDFSRAAAIVGPRDLYWAGRATLATGPDEIRVYDRVFRGLTEPQPPTPLAKARAVAAGDEDERAGEAVDEPEVALASRIEVLRHKSFEDCSREELDELARLARRLVLPTRRSRRRRASRAGALDLPRTFRRSLRTGGEPFDRRYRERARVARPLVLLLDVSNSMTQYSRGPLVLAHALLRVRPHVEVFCFGTRLTRITRALAVRDPDDALRRAAEEVVDWDGGTRIGDSVKALLATGAARGAVVVVCSDGLDVGDPQLLRAQMERLSRLAHRVVWLNPLKQVEGYEPLARGMAAALPFVDAFASGHTFAGIEALELA
jgi:uncharacterized protein